MIGQLSDRAIEGQHHRTHGGAGSAFAEQLPNHQIAQSLNSSQRAFEQRYRDSQRNGGKDREE